ncbi:MAG: T9SS type A sorting domain-containing protein, partial [Saprospiraceae bacterium]
AIETPSSAKDTINNFDYCETYVLVQDNPADGITINCANGASGLIAGIVATEEANPVQDVTVQMSGQRSGTVPTTNLGQYGFRNLQLGYDYTITPEYDANHSNGVSTFDIVMITKHILGVQLLNSPYKMIAADVNSSKTITTLDLIQMRKLILYIDIRFRNNTSWRFVDKKYTFPDPNNPWAEDFPEIININDLAGAINNADFVAVKIGDVNANAQTTSLTNTEDRDFKGNFYFQVTNETLAAGNTYTIDFRANDLAAIQGFQGTLTFDANSVELVDIVEGVAKAENFGLRFVEQGVITTSWNGEAADNAVLFSLVVKAKTNAEVSNLFGISSRYTVAEAYATDNSLLNVGIRFSNGAVVGTGFELFQNQPNPFKGRTVIRFQLPEAADATLTVSDITGKVIKLVRGSYAKGLNQIELNSQELPAGVLSYTLSTNEFTATRKMIVTK